jgi:hypothetical protein
MDLHFWFQKRSKLVISEVSIMVFVALPVLAGLMLFACFNKKSNSWRRAFLSASLIWGLIVVVTTELLSLFTLLAFIPLASCWAAIDIVLLILFIYSKEPSKINKKPLMSWLKSFPFIFGWLSLTIIFIGIIAFVAPPNTADSMTYHMARVVHWIQQGSVAHYPTHILRQLFQNPWSEFAIMHFQILSDGDRFANLIQWFSMIGSAIGVSLLAKHFGAKMRGQIYSAVLSVTIPMGILQASSTQNDYVLSFWLVCFVYFLLKLAHSKGSLKESARRWLALAVAVSLGLAVLSKSTAYIFVLPFTIWFAIKVISSKDSFLKLWKPALIIATVALVINGGHYARNYKLFDSPFGITQEVSMYQKGDSVIFTNEVFTLPTFISNVVKNISLHLITPNKELFAVLEQAVQKIHNILGVDLHDPRTSWPLAKFGLWLANSTASEICAGNVIHLILIMVAISIYWLTSYKTNHAIASYMILLTTGFLLFCLILKWQPWHSRLHLPLFILWTPAIAVVLINSNKKYVINLTVALLMASSLIWMFNSETKPLLGDYSIFRANRETQYFYSSHLNVEVCYRIAAQYIQQQKYKSIGLSLAGSEIQKYEYLLWVLLRDGNGNYPRIEHIDMDNSSNTIARAAFQPEAVVCVECDKDKTLKYFRTIGPLHEVEWIYIFGFKKDQN